MFVSTTFLLFMGLVVTCFFCVRIEWRAKVLLAASWIFCGLIDIRSLSVLILVSVSAYFWGIALEKRERKKILLIVVIVGYVLLICMYKYIPYGIYHFGWQDKMTENILSTLVMPIGLSFYLFQVIGYLMDIYHGKVQAERNFWDLALCFAFFAKLVSGPVERESDFLKQIKSLDQVRFWNKGRLSTALMYLLWGYFLKMVIADRLAITVDRIFESPGDFESVCLLVGMVFYTIQIYCDFAGYSYIALGCARIFGIELTNNFKAPYYAVSITDFWRRWHISLSSWLKDYVYIPLGGNRKGTARKYINIMIVFAICGMWHGSGINFLVWGLLHGSYLVIENTVCKYGRLKIPETVRRIFTFCQVSVAWVFFRADSIETALAYFVSLLTTGIHLENYELIKISLQINKIEMTVICVGIGIVAAVDWICSRKKEQFPDIIQHRGNAVRYFVFYLLAIVIFIFGMYGPGYHAEDFIYMRF